MNPNNDSSMISINPVPGIIYPNREKQAEFLGK
jgi:hypothetical protein